jgi:hypothetical protein
MKWQPMEWVPEGQDYKKCLLPVTINRVPWCDGPDRYAVKNGNFCINKDGDSEYEPMGSQRDDEFFARCRYNTFEEAETAYIKWCKNNPDVARRMKVVTA